MRFLGTIFIHFDPVGKQCDRLDSRSRFQGLQFFCTRSAIAQLFIPLLHTMFYTFFSLRIPLVNESTEIRAATLRTIRHLTTTNEAATAISILNIHYLIRQKNPTFLCFRSLIFNSQDKSDQKLT